VECKSIAVFINNQRKEFKTNKEYFTFLLLKKVFYFGGREKSHLSLGPKNFSGEGETLLNIHMSSGRAHKNISLRAIPFSLYHISCAAHFYFLSSSLSFAAKPFFLFS
jgi:hypothetical protein